MEFKTIGCKRALSCFPLNIKCSGDWRFEWKWKEKKMEKIVNVLYRNWHNNSYFFNGCFFLQIKKKEGPKLNLN